jgi:hypothetical protein
MASQPTPLTTRDSPLRDGARLDPNIGNMSKDNKMEDAPLTMTVPEAGWRYLGLNRNASYAAAARGEIPTIRVGRLLRVPVRAMERLLDAAGGRGAG